jgi:glycosyltransferase involved in cell wall biosynthesis
MKLVSVIVPTYNRAGLIEETLDSVAAQTYRPVELIVSDDASTDGTSGLVERWGGKGSLRSCRYLPLSSNSGKSAAVNAALGIATGEYVMILDSDDLLLPEAIATQVGFLERHPEAGMVSANALELAGSRKTGTVLGSFGRNIGGGIGGSFGEGAEIPDVVRVHGSLLLNGNTVISSTALIRRRAIDAVGRLDETLQIVHDWDYWIRISKKFPIGYVRTPLVYYRTGWTGALSRDRVKLFLESRELLLRELPHVSKPGLLRSLAFQTKMNARLAYSDGNISQAFRILLAGGWSVMRALLPRGSGR